MTRTGNVGDLHKNSYDEIATSPQMNEFRRKMLNGEYSRECSPCHYRDTNNLASVRKILNKKYENDIQNLIENTNEDGSLKNPWEMRHIHITINNLCNLSCRTCSPDYSSVIATEQKRKHPVVSIMDIRPTYKDEVMKHLPSAKSISFAGGESLLSDEVWDMLERLLLANNTNVDLTWYSNMNKIEHKGKNLITYLEKFPNSKLHLSIDAMGEQAEILRNGSKWDKVLENVLSVTNSTINYEFNITISAINIWHVVDLVEFLIKTIPNAADRILLNPVTLPFHLSAKLLPAAAKADVIVKINEHKRHVDKKLAYQWANIVDFMMADDWSDKIPAFIEYNNNLDQLRDQKLLDVFPELSTVYEFSRTSQL